jgi:ferritin-like metal-binding protein YciE
MMRLDSFENLFVDQLRDLYSAEQQLTKALPKMAEAASSQELKQALTMHLEQTKQHAEHLKQLITGMDERPTGETCKAMQGLIEEGEEVIDKKRADESVRDAAIIAAAQRVEHYEISGYGTARTFAQRLGNQEAAQILDQILQQESQADEKLTQIAMSSVNQQAAQGAGSSRSGNGSSQGSSRRSN